MTFKIAFYKGRGRLLDKVIKWWDNGPYSHCEIVFSDGVRGTARYDHGVALYQANAETQDWDFIILPTEVEASARAWFEGHQGKAYDYVGFLRFVFDFLNPSRDKWFCSRACADALYIADGWRVGPNGLAAILKSSRLPYARH